MAAYRESSVQSKRLGKIDAGGQEMKIIRSFTLLIGRMLECKSQESSKSAWDKWILRMLCTVSCSKRDERSGMFHRFGLKSIISRTFRAGSWITSSLGDGLKLSIPGIHGSSQAEVVEPFPIEKQVLAWIVSLHHWRPFQIGEAEGRLVEFRKLPYLALKALPARLSLRFVSA
ncbi:hypothetical protein CRG98_030716 [Punica granatum]|uniref:Uncharacterized protein n=1 Tax=Punica granatum TaxID=22663 RepID=A0A2I0IXY3_PUNGR|nr:hypothetical protein CRG98_030716 [Punica granatum]